MMAPPKKSPYNCIKLGELYIVFTPFSIQKAHNKVYLLVTSMYFLFQTGH